ncbi:MAG: flagellar hook assembly protein FlgD [Alphaproteobacteria bacterium]|nr:flagellar hook assembly protein FlgD [Alphaproteobacteria bacterium]
MEVREVNGVQIVEQQAGDTNSTASIAENFDNFLTLLTTQLQNQDPLSPMDTTEFTNQITQFAQVEQSINTNNKLDRLIDLQNTSQITTGVAYIGKLAEAPGDLMVLEDGSGRIGYEFNQNAEQVTIGIIDQFGNLVRSDSGFTSAGRHIYQWDGRDDLGNLVSDGEYQVLVSAVGPEDSFIAVDTTTFAKVTGVEAADGRVTLNMGSLSVDLEDVKSISLPDEPSES